MLRARVARAPCAPAQDLRRECPAVPVEGARVVALAPACRAARFAQRPSVMVAPYKRILLPLDGSKLAESALLDAFAIAENGGAEVTLLRVVTPTEDLLEVDCDSRHVDEELESRRGQALEYLDRLRHRAGGRPITSHVRVEVGAPAEAILDYARTHETDLIVMATHGRSRLTRWALGSVAEKVSRGAEAPVLLVRPPA